jgi:filamentous hemagglutinin
VHTYTVNGRTYGVEAGGTLFPMTGDGFIMLNRNAYKVLGILNKFGDTPRALEIIELQRPSAKFTDADIESGRQAWHAGQGGGE